MLRYRFHGRARIIALPKTLLNKQSFIQRFGEQDISHFIERNDHDYE
jgi:hypothetical protein